MTWEVATFWVAVASAGIAALSVLVTVVYGEIQRRGQVSQRSQSEEQLRLAREQAELRPKLSVSLRPLLYQPRPPDAGWFHDKVALIFDVANAGKSAAHNIRIKITLDEKRFAPDEMNISIPQNPIPHLGPSDSVPHQLNVEVLSYGPTKADYVCSCDEVGPSEGTIEFEVHERK
jgi:hypothetical protein